MDVIEATKSIVFSASFYEAYTLKNLIFTIYKETSITNMIITPEGININFINSSKNGLYEINIKGSELLDFKCQEKFLMIGFDTKQMYNSIKSLSKKDGLVIEKLELEQRLRIQPIKCGCNNINFVDIIQVEENVNILPFYNTLEPNIRIQSNEFTNMCNQLMIMKCEKVVINGYEKVAILTGLRSNGTKAFIQKFGKGEIENEVITFLISSKIMKSISKINNISTPGSMVQVFFQKERPMKIVTPIGTYGTFILVLRSDLK